MSLRSSKKLRRRKTRNHIERLSWAQLNWGGLNLWFGLSLNCKHKTTRRTRTRWWWFKIQDEKEVIIMKQDRKYFKNLIANWCYCTCYSVCCLYDESLYSLNLNQEFWLAANQIKLIISFESYWCGKIVVK